MKTDGSVSINCSSCSIQLPTIDERSPNICVYICCANKCIPARCTERQSLCCIQKIKSKNNSSTLSMASWFPTATHHLLTHTPSVRHFPTLPGSLFGESIEITQHVNKYEHTDAYTQAQMQSQCISITLDSKSAEGSDRVAIIAAHRHTLIRNT